MLFLKQRIGFSSVFSVSLWFSSWLFFFNKNYLFFSAASASLRFRFLH